MRTLCALAALLLVAGAGAGELQDIYKELVEIDTTHDSGSTTKAAEAAAARLKAAGIPAADVQVLVPPGKPTKGNLVARIRGSGARRPILLLAHLDVVEAKKEDRSTDPFQLVEEDGYSYGRGTTDDNAMATIWVVTLIRHHKYKPPLARDIILALTADEESGPDNGVSWLIANHRDLIDAAYTLNEGGGGQIKGGKYIANEVQVAEKVYLNFALETTNPGGHSSRPTKANAIYHLGGARARQAKTDSPAPREEGPAPMSATLPKAPGIKGAAALPAPARRYGPKAPARLSKNPAYNAL